MAIAIGPILGLIAAYAWARSPYVTGQDVTITQPVPFSHAHHVGGLGLDCRFCHAGVETTAVASVPATEVCMTCHSQVWTGAALLQPVRDSLASGQPIAWQKVHRPPDYVYFDHSVHLAKGVGCTTCHGPVDTMPLMRQVAPLTMGWCLDCHQDPTPNLRPLAQVFSTDWAPGPDQAERGAALRRDLHVRLEGLADCSVCHR